MDVVIGLHPLLILLRCPSTVPVRHILPLLFIPKPTAKGATAGAAGKPKIVDTFVELGSTEGIEGVNGEIFSPVTPVAANEPAIVDKSIALDATGAAEKERCLSSQARWTRCADTMI